MAKRKRKGSRSKKGWDVKCGKSTRSHHRKKSAANKAAPDSCRVVKHR